MEREELIRGHYCQTLTAMQEEEYARQYGANPDFKVRSEEMELELLAAQEVGRAKLSVEFSKWEMQEPKDNIDGNPKHGWLFLKLGMAASVVFALGWFLYPNATSEELFAAYYSTYPNYEMTTTRGDSTMNFSDRELAYQYYDRGDFEKAKMLFSNYLVVNSDDVPAMFFRGMSGLELSRMDDVKADLMQVKTSQHAIYVNAAKWYLALIYLQEGDEKKCMMLLEELANEPNEFSVPALKLINDL